MKQLAGSPKVVDLTGPLTEHAAVRRCAAPTGLAICTRPCGSHEVGSPPAGTRELGPPGWREGLSCHQRF